MKAKRNEPDPTILPIDWIRAEQYCKATGDPMYVVQERIRDGVWASGKHYKRTGARTLWINLAAVGKWIEQQPDVETTVFPKASKYERESEARAFG